MWLTVFLVTLVIELLTTALITIWFAIGSLVSLILSWFGVPLIVQIVTFVVVSLLSFIFTKPYVQKRLLPKDKIEKTNIDALIGQNAVVTVEISNLDNKGEVLLEGKFWTARSIDNEFIPLSATVQVERIEGVKVIVKQGLTKKINEEKGENQI